MVAQVDARGEGAANALGPGKYRWVVVALLFAAMVINYIDRQMIGVLKPGYLQPEFGWSERDYANIVTWFQAAYALSYLVFGRVVDRIGAKWGLGIAFTLWTVAHILHAGARNLAHFVMVRVLLGIGEGGGFPASIKAVTEWFPKRERALATGIFNAGTNIGAIVTPLLVPFIVVDLAMGWRASFVIVGVATLLWLPAWWLLYSQPHGNKRVSAQELALIESDPPDSAQRMPLSAVFRMRQTWAYAAGKFLIDPVWWMFLFWLPDFLSRTRGLDLRSFGLPIVAVYLASDVGSIAGGWLSSRLLSRGWSLAKARKTAMFVCALCALPVMFAAKVSGLWQAVGIICLATAAHQGFSANLYTLPGDVFPRSAVATVIGIGGMLGGVGGMLFAQYVGAVLQTVGDYTPIFMVCGCVYLLALLVVHWLARDYSPVDAGGIKP
ncbi:MFS transporter [Steroidobacter sp.]|uniref:MFS transporter n=1 Tax=Steroidobacter sp. TaxID=1978227 RepID=UPI001A36702B|nr:MFS transporter [Steroidobacter sp.]MBL8265122.1 MFS transporter [Steroidobacter sp.]